MKTVEQVRRDMPVLEGKVFLNAGSLCPTPLPVMDAFFDSYRRWHERGAGHPPHYEEMRDQVTWRVREKLAAFINGEAAEVSLTANATEGINIVAWGMPWQSGDEVIITDAEHPANAAVWLYNSERFGIKVRYLPAYTEPESIVERLQAMMTRRTRLVAVSHVLSATGRILPVVEMARVCRDGGCLLLVDGAHAIGQMPVDVRAIDCDFYSTNGHKWLFGPAGTGFLYVRRSLQPLIRPAFVGDTGGKILVNREGGSFVPPDDGRRYEYATRNWAMQEALGHAVDYVTDIGLDRIRARVVELTGYLKQKLLAMPDMDLWSPLAADESASLVCFGIKGHSAPAISSFLEGRKIYVRHVTEDLLRVSIGYFTTTEELDALVDALLCYRSEC